MNRISGVVVGSEDGSDVDQNVNALSLRAGGDGLGDGGDQSDEGQEDTTIPSAYLASGGDNVDPETGEPTDPITD